MCDLVVAGNSSMNWSPVLTAQKTAGKSKWQSYSQGWKSYNKPHCLSVGHLLFAIFLYKLLFPPVDISSQSTDSEAHFTPSFQNLPPPLLSCPPLPPLAGWLSLAMAHYSSWQCQPLFQPLTHKLQIAFISPSIFKWILLAWSEEAHSPPSSPPLCVSVLSSLQKALLAWINDNNSSTFSSLSHAFVCLPLSVNSNSFFGTT